MVLERRGAKTDETRRPNKKAGWLACMACRQGPGRPLSGCEHKP